MQIIDKAITPDGIEIELRDLSGEHKLPDYNGMEIAFRSKRPKVSAEVKPAVQTPLSTEPSDSVSEDIDDIDMEDSVDTSEEVASDYPDDLNFVIRTMFKECQDKELKSQVKSVIAEYGKLNDVDEDGLKKIYDMMK